MTDIDRVHVDKVIITNIPHCVLLLDENGVILESNPAVRQMFERLEGELEGRCISDIIIEYKDIAPVACQPVCLPGNLELFEDEGPCQDKITTTLMESLYHRYLAHPDEQPVVRLRIACRRENVWVKAQLLCDRFNDKTVYILSLYDVTESYQQKRRLEYNATHDSMTGLLNMQGIQQHIEENRGAKGCVLYCLEVNNFGRISTALGYEVSCQLLKIFAQSLQFELSGFRLSYARLEHGTFAITDTGFASERRTEAILEALARLSSTLAEISGMNIKIGLSGGVVMGSREDSGATLIHHGLIALSQLSESSEFRYRIFEDAMAAESRETHTIANGVFKALAQNEFSLVYQPIVDTSRHNKIVGYETLVRWQSNNVSVSPARFIPILEATGGIIALGKWILNKALRDFQTHFLKQTDLYISVNLSGRQVEDDMAFNELIHIVQSYGIEPARINFELTETSHLVFDDPQIRAKLQLLRQKGFGMSIDDFGTGHSTLARLDPHYFSELKIDRMFINQIDGDGTLPIILRNTIALVSELGIGIVAEGVETAQQVDYLSRFEGVKIQGYYFYKPVSIAELAAQVQQNGTQRDEPWRVIYAG